MKKEQKIQGSFPHIFEHYQAMPACYQFEKMPIEKLSEEISRQYIYASQSMLVKWIFKTGAHIPLHHHLSEQITWIIEGKVKVYSQGKEFIIAAGEVIVPPHVPHEFFALEDTIDIDVLAPVREDWINQLDHFYKKS